MVRLVLSMGDPAGVGPELCVKAADSEKFRGRIAFSICGSPSVIREAAKRFTEGRMPEIIPASAMSFNEVEIGTATAESGRCACDSLDVAMELVISKAMDALVTAPMNKYAVNLAGIPFTGHTERLAERCGVKDYVMMQSSGSLRVVFVTTHIALAEVPAAITGERIEVTTRLLRDAARSEGIENPKIGIAAINPHAGENGCMGKEDELVVKPAVARLRESGIDVEGPFPPDVVFTERIRGRFDGIVAMYHDQGHIPVKMLAFDRCVNSTLGLPIIRTSPDHGTAFDIAWKGTADTGSFFAAVELAASRAEGGKKNA
ncbi:MAG: 4-hydroxythreonine-4-phosphate dehydrogenase PdxA [Victivallaceae bacterium]|nr:4-hydroxythreonine-4-phosphate dehydrogenase PdxA [Victivallaceae bacterium]